ncbi:MAG: TonB-dependent receptor, partial [Gammaproteobacteria bacterium]|nr:TonB-dependent receptor [Gammaproteobacteria bacterium]
QSALYGSDAIGGVIQIFTRKTSGPQVSFSGGSYNTWKGMIGTGGRIGEASYHLNVTQTDSEGFSATNPDSENDKDGYEARSITASLDSPIGNSAALSIQLFQGDNQVEFDAGSVGSYTDNTNRTVNAKLSWDTTDNWQQHFSLGSSTDHSETFSIWTDDITSRTRTLNWQNDLQLGEQSLLTVGAEQFKTTGENSGNFNKTVKNDALFAQYQTSLSAIDLNIGLREDDNGQYGTHATGHIGLGKALGSGRMFFNHGTAFKAPGFNNLYYPFFSNPDLKPEESTSSEIGYRQGKLQVSLFDTRIEQLIALDAFWIPQNIEKAKVQGLELEYGFILGEWDINTGLTLQDPKNETNDSQLLRRAKQKLFVNINGSVTEKLRSGITINHVGERDDVGGIKLNTYTLLNLTGSLQLSDEYSLNARIENLLDEEYELVSGYGTAGRSAYISLQYKP